MNINMTMYAALLIFLGQPLSAQTLTQPVPQSIPTIPYQLLDSAAHPDSTFTQGFIKEGETFYESSGLYKRSYIRRYRKNASTTANLPSRYFAEGLTLFKNQLFLITWKEETLFIINKDTLKSVKTMSYQGEGWGLTHNNKELIMSNGSSTLFFRKPEDFSIIRTVNVKHLNLINELEYVDGIIWANSLNDDHIYAIQPDSGCIIAAINFNQLRQQTVPIKSSTVLNGIAYDSHHNGLWITGKFWPKRYLIALPELNTHQISC